MFVPVGVTIADWASRRRIRRRNSSVPSTAVTAAETRPVVSAPTDRGAVVDDERAAA